MRALDSMVLFGNGYFHVDYFPTPILLLFTRRVVVYPSCCCLPAVLLFTRCVVVYPSCCCLPVVLLFIRRVVVHPSFARQDLRNMALGQPHAAATPAVHRQPGFGDGASQTPKPTAAVPPMQAAAAAAAVAPPAWQDDDLDIPDLPELTFDVGMFAKLRVRDGLLNVPSAT